MMGEAPSPNVVLLTLPDATEVKLTWFCPWTLFTDTYKVWLTCTKPLVLHRSTVNNHGLDHCLWSWIPCTAFLCKLQISSKQSHASWWGHQEFFGFPMCHAHAGVNWDHHFRLMWYTHPPPPTRLLCSCYIFCLWQGCRTPTCMNLDPLSIYLWLF